MKDKADVEGESDSEQKAVRMKPNAKPLEEGTIAQQTGTIWDSVQCTHRDSFLLVRGARWFAAGLRRQSGAGRSGRRVGGNKRQRPGSCKRVRKTRFKLEQMPTAARLQEDRTKELQRARITDKLTEQSEHTSGSRFGRRFLFARSGRSGSGRRRFDFR